MPAKTDAQRRAEADARKRAAGLVRVSVWVPAEQKQALQEIGAIFRQANAELSGKAEHIEIVSWPNSKTGQWRVGSTYW
jgi:hypothetical protein